MKKSKWKSILNTKSILLCIVHPFELDIIISRLYSCRFIDTVLLLLLTLNRQQSSLAFNSEKCLAIKMKKRKRENGTKKHLSCRYLPLYWRKRTEDVKGRKGKREKFSHSINFYFIVFSNVCFDIITIRSYLFLNSWYIVLNYKRSSASTLKFKVVK